MNKKPHRLSHRVMLLGLLLMGYGLYATSPAQAQQMMNPPEFITTVPSNYGFDDTVDILKGAIEGENLMVIHEINAQRMLRMVDVQVGGMKQLLFFHPRYMKRIREANRNGTIVPPLKVAVMEMPNGKVMVRYPRPSHLFGPYEGLSEIAQELEEVVGKIVANVQN